MFRYKKHTYVIQRYLQFRMQTLKTVSKLFPIYFFPTQWEIFDQMLEYVDDYITEYHTFFYILCIIYLNSVMYAIE